MSQTVGPEHSGGCVLTLGAQLRGDVVAAQGGLVALPISMGNLPFGFQICMEES